MTMEIKRTLKIKDEDEARDFGLELGRCAKAGPGDRTLRRPGDRKDDSSPSISPAGLEVTETVNSPTFTIVKEYHSGRLPLYHFDVYRVQDPDELFNIGADEYFDGNGLCVVEWADMIKEELPPDSLYVYIEYGDKEGERVYKCTF